MSQQRHRSSKISWPFMGALILAVLAVALLLLGTLASRGALPYWISHPFDHSRTSTGADGQTVHVQEGKVGLTDQNDKYAPEPAKPFRNAKCNMAAEQQARPKPNNWQIPAIGQSAPLEETGPVSGPVSLPNAPAGIIYGSDAPLDASAGTSLLAGHVDHGPGDLSRQGGELSPFGHLHEVAPCSHVYVTATDNTVHEFVITDLYTVGQDQLPSEPGVFDTTGKRQLVMVTCSGPTVNDAGGNFQFNYQSNLVVKAAPVHT